MLTPFWESTLTRRNAANPLVAAPKRARRSAAVALRRHRHVPPASSRPLSSFARASTIASADLLAKATGGRGLEAGRLYARAVAPPSRARRWRAKSLNVASSPPPRTSTPRARPRPRHASSATGVVASRGRRGRCRTGASIAWRFGVFLEIDLSTAAGRDHQALAARAEELITAPASDDALARRHDVRRGDAGGDASRRTWLGVRLSVARPEAAGLGRRFKRSSCWPRRPGDDHGVGP